MPPNRSSWNSLIWWSRFTTGWIHSLITFLNHVHSVHNVFCSTSQDFIHKRRGNSFSFQNRMSGQKSFYSHKQWYAGPVSATGRWEEGAHSLEAVCPLTYLYVCISTDILSLFLLGVYLNSQRSVWHQGHRRPVRVTKNIWIFCIQIQTYYLFNVGL